MKMKRMSLIVLTVVLVFALVACTNNENIDNSNDIQNENQQEIEQQPDNQPNIIQQADGSQKDEEKNSKVNELLINNNWQCFKITDTDAKEVDMRMAFGSYCFSSPGSLKFNQNGTFTHILPGVTSDEFATDGTYTVNGIDLGLTYNDNRVNVGKIFISELESDSEVMLTDDDRGYNMYFKIVDNVEDEKNSEVNKLLINNNWQCFKITGTDAKEVDMRMAFGSYCFSSPGSLTFNQDGTFTHILPGVTSGEFATDGTYTVNGIDLGLTYNDNRVSVGKIFISELESDSEIMLTDDDMGYNMYFKIVK